MKRLTVSFLVGAVCVVLGAGTVWGTEPEQPANEPAVETQQEAPQLPGEPPAVPSPSAPEPPASPEAPAPAEAPPEAPADPCKGCACGGGMVTPGCLECCR